jgi:hypothetical protein
MNVRLPIAKRHPSIYAENGYQRRINIDTTNLTHSEGNTCDRGGKSPVGGDGENSLIME